VAREDGVDLAAGEKLGGQWAQALLTRGAAGGDQTDVVLVIC